MIKSNGAIIIALAAVFASLTGCTQQGSSDPKAILLMAAEQAKTAGSPENAEALKDGKFTEDEYFAAARRFQACYRDQGVVIGGPVVSPVDQLSLQWEYPETYSLNKSGTREIAKCISQWSPMAAAYTATHTQKMDESLRLAVIKCVEGAGYPLTGKESKAWDFVGDPHSDGGKQQTAVQKCIVDSAFKLFPDLPGGVTIIW